MATLFESKPFATGLTAIVSLIILLAYASAKTTVDRAAPVLFWIIVAIIGVLASVGLVFFFITQIEKLYTLRTQMKAARSIAHNEANAPLVITAKMDERLVVRDPDPDSYYRQLHLDPRTHVNGHHQAATAQEVQTYMALNSGGYSDQRSSGQLVIDQQSVMSGDIQPENILDRYNSEWIQSLLNAPHVHYCGATRSGKTTLANHHISHLAKNSDVKFFLINPKHTAARKPFIINPNFKDIDDALDGLQAFNSMMLKRKNDPALNGDEDKIIFIIDEWDWIYETYGQDATRLLIPLVKVGAELNIQVILIGQSPLTGDTGLSQSFYHNMIRVAIWQEGARLLANYSLDRKYKAPLQSQYEDLKAMATQYELSSGHKLRYCTVVPMAGNPTVEVVPYLEDPVLARKEPEAEKSRPIKGSYHEQVCLAWYQTLQLEYPTGNKMHKRITGNNVNLNAKKREDYRILLRKYGIDPTYF